MKFKNLTYLFLIFTVIWACKKTGEDSQNADSIAPTTVQADNSKDTVAQLNMDSIRLAQEKKSKDSIEKAALRDSAAAKQKRIHLQELSAMQTALSNLRVSKKADPVVEVDSTTVDSLGTKKVAKKGNGCSREKCDVFAKVSLKKQSLTLYVNGNYVTEIPVSSGKKGHGTPSMDRHPAGPIVKKYTSKKYPGGNYDGLGNMPYAVFISGGYAIHGTTYGNISKLGRKASHGCIRIHPENAKLFNQIVSKAGVENTWVTISNE